MLETYCFYCMSATPTGGPCPTCGLTAGSYVPLAHHLPPGTLLSDGRYLIGRALGNGGFGITYIGRDLTLGIRVAIKEYFPTGCATRTATVSHDVAYYSGVSKDSLALGRERFLEEARRLARQEKIAVVVGARTFFEENNTAYLVMEYVRGTTLAELAEQRGGRIAPDELLPLVRPLFPALTELHADGLIHRDISPDNLMLERGNIRLIDFGCARESAGGDHTMTSMLKVGYAPIEQYGNGEQGTWTDVYALCATLYRCLTGVRPPAAVDRTPKDDLIPPRKLGVTLTDQQEHALLVGLRILPRKRFKTIAQLEAALYEEPKEEPAVVSEGPITVTEGPAVVAEGPAVVADAPTAVTEGRSEDSVVVTEGPSEDSVVATDEPANEPIVVPEPPRPWYARIPWPMVIAAGVACAVIAGILWYAHPWSPPLGSDVTESETSAVRDPSAFEANFSTDLEDTFASARKISSYDELEKAERAGDPVVFVADTQLMSGFVTVPVLVPEGVTLSGPDVNSHGKNEAKLSFNDLVINHGTLRGNVGVSDDGKLVNYGTVGSEDNLYDCRISCQGTIANKGSIYCAPESFVSGDAVLYNRGYVMVANFYVQDNADVYNRSTLRVGGTGATLVHTSSKPIFNEREATLSVAKSASLGDSAYLCNWGTFEADSLSELGSPVIENEGTITTKVGIAQGNKCLVFGHGSLVAPSTFSAIIFGLSGTVGNGDAASPVPTIDTVDGTIAQVSTTEEFLQALEADDVAGIVVAGRIELRSDADISKPISIEEDGLLATTKDAKLTVRGCELRLSGKAKSLSAHDLDLLDGACLWGAGLEMATGSTLTAKGSLVNLYDPLAETPANDNLSSLSVKLDEGSAMLWSCKQANHCDVQVHGDSSLAIMGEVQHLVNDTKLDGKGGTLFLRGDVELRNSSIRMGDHEAWHEAGGSLTASGSTIELGGMSVTQDCKFWLTSGSKLYSSLWHVESFGECDKFLSIDEESIATNDDSLWVLTTHPVRLEGTIVNNGDLYLGEGVVEEEDRGHITGNGDVVQV